MERMISEAPVVTTPPLLLQNLAATTPRPIAIKKVSGPPLVSCRRRHPHLLTRTRNVFVSRSC